MIRGEVGVTKEHTPTIAIQVECLYDRKGFWRFAKCVPADGARRMLYKLVWEDLYTIYTLTFNRALNESESALLKMWDVPIFGHAVFEKGMRADFFGKQYGIDKIIHNTKQQLSIGHKFTGWYNLYNELVM